MTEPKCLKCGRTEAESDSLGTIYHVCTYAQPEPATHKFKPPPFDCDVDRAPLCRALVETDDKSRESGTGLWRQCFEPESADVHPSEATEPATLPVFEGGATGPCSACGDGDTALKYHSHGEPATPPLTELDESFLTQLRRISVLRAREDFKTYENAGLLYFTTALAGEVGELCNLIKKLERAKCGGPDHGNTSKLKDITPEKLRDEVAGIFIYLDLLASLLDVDIEQATVETFNGVSEKIGSQYRLVAPRLVERVREQDAEIASLNREMNNMLAEATKQDVIIVELKADKARLDWLEDAVSGGHVESAFEMDGGVHLTVCMAGDEPLELRDKNSVREAIDAALAKVESVDEGEK